jgi:hypothetical protein
MMTNAAIRNLFLVLGVTTMFLVSGAVEARIQTTDGCRTIRDARARADCTRCVSQGRHLYLPTARAGQRCQAIKAPPRARPAARPAVPSRAGSAAARGVAPAAPGAAMTGRGLVGLVGKKAAAPGIRNARDCKRLIRSPRDRMICQRCLGNAKPHAYHLRSPAGRRCQAISMVRPVAGGGSPVRGIAGRPVAGLKPAMRAGVAPVRTLRPAGRAGTKRPARVSPGAATARVATPRGVQSARGAAPSARTAASGSSLRNSAACRRSLRDRNAVSSCLRCVSRKAPHMYNPRAPAARSCLPAR